MGIPKKLCEYSKKKECFCIKHFMLCDSFWIYHSICSSCQISQCYCWIFIIGFPLKHIVPTHALITRARTHTGETNQCATNTASRNNNKLLWHLPRKQLVFCYSYYMIYRIYKAIAASWLASLCRLECAWELCSNWGTCLNQCVLPFASTIIIGFCS